MHRLCHSDVVTLEGKGPASFSPDGSRVLTRSQDGSAKVWDSKTGAEILTIKLPTGRVESAEFSPDGSRIVTTTDYLTVKIGRDESMIVTESDFKSVKIWEARTGAEIHTLKGHNGWVTSAMFSPGGARVLHPVKTEQRRCGTRRLAPSLND